MEIDWTTPDEMEGGLDRPGVYRAHVSKCIEKMSKNGNAMFELTLVATDFGDKFLCRDFIMMSGAGLGIGRRKLKGLGFSEDDKWIDEAMILSKGKDILVSVEAEDYEYEGETRRRLVMNNEVGRFGYIDGEDPTDYDILTPDNSEIPF